MLEHVLVDGLVVINQFRSRPATQPACRQPPVTGTPLARFDDVGRADAQAFRNVPRAFVISRQHAISEILRVGLPPPPSHRCLRSLPETHESQHTPVP